MELVQPYMDNQCYEICGVKLYVGDCIELIHGTFSRRVKGVFKGIDSAGWVVVQEDYNGNEVVLNPLYIHDIRVHYM
jgi:hypothetical protein